MQEAGQGQRHAAAGAGREEALPPLLPPAAAAAGLSGASGTPGGMAPSLPAAPASIPCAVAVTSSLSPPPPPPTTAPVTAALLQTSSPLAPAAPSLSGPAEVASARSSPGALALDSTQPPPTKKKKKALYMVDGRPTQPYSSSSPSALASSSDLEEEKSKGGCGGMLLRVVVLLMLMLLNTVNFWDRNLLYNLSATETPGCDQVCADAVAVPTCLECVDVMGSSPNGGGGGLPSSEEEDRCEVCRLCRISFDSDYYNIRDGACLSSGQYALLSGFGFTLSFAFIGVFAGYLADRYDRRVVHTGAILLWSLATVCSGMCTGFWPLLACRMLLGVAQAFNAPCCYALLTAHFPESQRSLANGIYSMGTYLGAGLSSLSILLALQVGWRNASYTAGTVGLALALVYSMLINNNSQKKKDKSNKLAYRHEEEDEGETCSQAMEAASEVLSSYSMLLLCLGSSLRMVGTTTMAAYLPVLYQRTFLSHVQHFSLLNALGYSLCGSLSSSFGGLMAGQLAKRRRPSALAFLPAVGVAAAILPLAVLVVCPSFWPAMGALLAQYMLAECWLGPGMAILQRELRPQVQGMAVAVLLLGNNLLCNLGPAAVGMVDDGSASSLRAIFLAVMLASYVGSSLVFAILGLHLHQQHNHNSRTSIGRQEAPAGPAKRQGARSSRGRGGVGGVWGLLEEGEPLLPSKQTGSSTRGDDSPRQQQQQQQEEGSSRGRRVVTL